MPTDKTVCIIIDEEDPEILIDTMAVKLNDIFDKIKAFL